MFFVYSKSQIGPTFIIVSSLKMENGLLKQELNSLENQLSVVENQMGAGAFNTSRYKVNLIYRDDLLSPIYHRY